MWGAKLIDQSTFDQASLIGGTNSLYAISEGYLDRISPATGNVVASAPYNAPTPGPPVVLGSTVWVVSSYAGRDVVLKGYDAKTLAQVASVIVPVSGQVSAVGEGVLTSGPDGDLYVAAGSSVGVVNPSTHQVIRQISVSAGPVNSVAVAPDGGRLYVSTGSFELLTYNLGTGALLRSSAAADIGSSGGNLVATSGGVWGTLGVGMSEWVWFAPNADLTRIVRVSLGAGAGLASVPVFSGGTVWIGGSHTLVCASPATGQVLASGTIPTDGGVVEYFGSVTITGGHAYAYYLDQRAQQSGVVTLTTPSACSG
jgi:WD40 repeat protein